MAPVDQQLLAEEKRQFQQETQGLEHITVEANKWGKVHWRYPEGYVPNEIKVSKTTEMSDETLLLAMVIASYLHMPNREGDSISINRARKYVSTDQQDTRSLKERLFQVKDQRTPTEAFMADEYHTHDRNSSARYLSVQKQGDYFVMNGREIMTDGTIPKKRTDADVFDILRSADHLIPTIKADLATTGVAGFLLRYTQKYKRSMLPQKDS